MAITTLSSREFNQDTGRAKKASRKGPVFIIYLRCTRGLALASAVSCLW
jgi:hypothetical protein